MNRQVNQDKDMNVYQISFRLLLSSFILVNFQTCDDAFFSLSLSTLKISHIFRIFFSSSISSFNSVFVYSGFSTFNLC